MSKEIVNEPLGSEGQLQLVVEEGKVKLKIAHQHKSGSAVVEVVEDPDYFIDMLCAAIPGKLDDAVGEMLKKAIKDL